MWLKCASSFNPPFFCCAVVVGSPFKVSFSSGAVAPEHATVEGDGVSGGAVGIPIVVLVQLRDQFSNPVSASANVTLTVASANKTLINAIVNASSGKEDEEGNSLSFLIVFFFSEKKKFPVDTWLFGIRRLQAGIHMSFE